MKLFDFLNQEPLDTHELSTHRLADKYHVSLDEVFARLDAGTKIEMQRINNRYMAKKTALKHLCERLDYYENFTHVDEKLEPEPDHAPYPGQSRGRLRKFIKRKYHKNMSCRTAGTVLNDPDAGPFYKRRAVWYKNLYCRGRRQIREDELTLPDDVNDFVDRLRSNDVGHERVGNYTVHFKGFDDHCQKQAQHRCNLDPTDSQYLKHYDDIYEEILANFISSQNGSQPVIYGLSGDDTHPVLYAVFDNPSGNNNDMEAHITESLEKIQRKILNSISNIV